MFPLKNLARKGLNSPIGNIYNSDSIFPTKIPLQRTA